MFVDKAKEAEVNFDESGSSDRLLRCSSTDELREIPTLLLSLQLSRHTPATLLPLLV